MLWQAGTLDSWLDRLEPFDREPAAVVDGETTVRSHRPT